MGPQQAPRGLTACVLCLTLCGDSGAGRDARSRCSLLSGWVSGCGNSAFLGSEDAQEGLGLFMDIPLACRLGNTMSSITGKNSLPTECVVQVQRGPQGQRQGCRQRMEPGLSPLGGEGGQAITAPLTQPFHQRNGQTHAFPCRAEGRPVG